MTELLNILRERVEQGEWNEFLSESLENIKRKIELHPFNTGYIDRVREIESMIKRLPELPELELD